MFSNISIKLRLALAFGFVLVIFSVVVAMTSVMTSRVRSMAESISNDLVPQVKTADALALALQGESSGLRGYVLTHDPKFYHDYKSAVVDRKSSLAQLQSLVTRAEERSELRQMEQDVSLLELDESRTIRLLQDKDGKRAYRCHQLYVRGRAMKITQQAESIAKVVHHRIDVASDELEQTTDRMLNANIWSFVIAVLSTLGFTIATVRAITRPAAKIALATQSIAEGDYGQAQSLESVDPHSSKPQPSNELQKIAAAVAEMAHILERRQASLTGFADIGRVCASTIQLDRLIDGALCELAAHSRSHVAALYLPKDGKLVAAGTYGLSTELAASALADPGGLVDQVSKTGKTVVISDIPSDTKFSILMGIGAMTPKTIACVPMPVEETDTGVIVVATVYDYDAAKVRFIETAAAQMGVAISNAVRHSCIEELASDLQERNDMLDAQNEELQSQNEELQSQGEEIQAQSEEILAQNEELSAQAAELSAAEAQARSDRDYLETIIDTIPEAVVIATAPEGRMTIANKVALRLLGMESLPDATAMEHTAVFGIKRLNGDPYPPEELPLAKAIFDGVPVSGVELVINRPSGDEVIVQVSSVPIRDHEGSVTGGIAVFQDVSEMKEQQRLRDEIYEHQRYIARELQKAFLPDPKAHPVMPNYETAASYEPAQSSKADVGGDFYDLIPLGGDLVGVVMADVSGKGVKAAVYTAMAKYMLRGFAHEDHQPISLITRLNEALTRYVQGEVFVTLFYGVLDAKEGRLIYTNAGHEPPVIFRCEDGTCTALDSTGPALGIIKEGRYAQKDAVLRDGDALVLFTDGVIDAQCGKQFLGSVGLEEIIAEVGDVSAHEMIDGILSKVRAYSDRQLRDDAAILVAKSLVRRNGRA